ncbi:unnamed protein product [Oppiella nova]|uniref:C2H2-type domain-containing protein n=1 Tax=Oppiella nova TaxID=334625 RepID=A0A7R9Q9H8_9ACAR|nr:unnamed protein product [Oppiella nova]CAG2161001.1 unnamed protein product [Oppiella nova]
MNTHNANYNDNQLSDESEEHREIQGLHEVLDENSGEPEAHVVSEETQKVQTLDTEVDDRDRDETEGPEEMSGPKEGEESGVGEDDREGIDNCEPIVSTSSSGAKSIPNDRPFVCFWPKCGKRFTRKDHLNRHKSAVHLKEKRLKCDYKGCGLRFARTRNVILHKRVHSGEKPYVCDVMDCDKRFAKKSYLNQHKRAVHLKVKGFKCYYKGCDQRCALKSDLNRHKRVHSGEKPYACDVMHCDKRFTKKSTVIQHRNAVHLKLKPFVCDEDNCGKKFTEKAALIYHKRIHTGEKPYVCGHKDCGKLFGQCLAQDIPWEPRAREIIFVGDSITQGWQSLGKAVWDKYYTPRHAYNYGISGDRTENVIFRIRDKEFDGLNPKVAVLMIGTNNIGWNNTVEDAAHGVQEVLKELTAKMSTTKVILLSNLPRTQPNCSKCKQLNVLLEKFADNKTIFYLDLWSHYETPDGKQKFELFVDKLHLNEKGFEVWQQTMDPNPWEPLARDDLFWMNRHRALIKQTVAHKTDAQIILVGDSITEDWGSQGKEVWDKYYAPRHAYNYGISGDKTENLIHRLRNGELDGLNPKITVLMIGTNNIGWGDRVEDIARGVEVIVNELLAKMSDTKLILLGILPMVDSCNARVRKVNSLNKKLNNDRNVFFLDMWSSFEGTVGTQNTELYAYDRLHLNEKGYELWQKTMEPLLKKLDPNL